MEIKVPRFMREFANYQKNRIQANNRLLEPFKHSAIVRIDAAVRNFSRGLATVREAMNVISNPFARNLDNLNKVEVFAIQLDEE